MDRDKWGNTEDSGCPTIFLPGWGFDGKVVTLADQQLPWIYPLFFLDPATFEDELLLYLKEKSIAQIYLVGWSMGGNLALDFAKKHPEKVVGIYLLGVRAAWPEAEIESIREELEESPRRFMRSFYRKCFLGDKERYNCFVTCLQHDYLARLDLDTLRSGLEFLQKAGSKKSALLQVDKVFCMHGEKDIVAPAAEMFRVPGGEILIEEHAGHAFFLRQGFRLPHVGRKEGIRKRFSRAAETYDAYADVQKSLAERLFATISKGRIFKRILEIGCGTGNLTQQLIKLYPEAPYVAVDFSAEMLAVAREKMPPSDSLHFICEDGEHFLAAGREKFDLIVSNATMQWFDDLETAFFHAGKMLETGGCFCASIFGPRSLKELAQGLASVSGQPVSLPASHFPDEEQLRDLLKKYFKKIHVETWKVCKEYGSIHDMLIPIAKTGTTGWQAGGARLTPDRLKRLSDWFVETYGGYKLTYQATIIICES